MNGNYKEIKKWKLSLSFLLLRLKEHYAQHQEKLSATLSEHFFTVLVNNKVIFFKQSIYKMEAYKNKFCQPDTVGEC